MSEQPNDKLLDENISRLLNSRPERPQLPADAQRQMLASLSAKQQALYPRKEQTMDVAAPSPASGPAAARQQAYTLATVLLAMAVGVLIALWLNQNPAPEKGGRAVVAPESKDVKAEKVQRETLPDGTVVIAREGAEYSVEDRKLTLKNGDLYLIVAKSEKPFVVRTRDGSVTARGTRFAVSANEQTTAAVGQGRVELAGDGGRVELRAGQQGTLTAGEKPKRQPAPRLSYLVSWAKQQLAQEEPLVEKAAAQSGLVAMDPWGQEIRLTLRKYDVDVYIEDGIARTTIDQTFFNHNPWNTEGTFYFPLPPDASVSRLAMYVFGHLNEGGMVERGYGQQVYNDIRYQWRDPALLEMMEGNVFKMRIFPLEGRQEKRVFLSYTQTLEELYGTLRYWFPMDHTHSVARQLSIRVQVKDGKDVRSQVQHAQLRNRHRRQRPGAAVQRRRCEARSRFSVESAACPEPSRVARGYGEKDGQQFLFARIKPKLTGSVEHRPRQWVVLNDVSASRTAIEAEAQRYILHRLIQEADDDDSFAVIDLNTRATTRTDGFLPIQEARKTDFSLANSSTSDRSARLKSRLLGATNIEAGLQAVTDFIKRHGAENPHILYLGDGMATDGQTEIASLVRKIPKGATFVGMGVGKKVEAKFLQAAADTTGGMYAVINPDEDIDWRVFDLLAALNTPRLTGLKVSLQSGDRGTEETIAYPSSRVLADGETLQVVARFGEDLPTQLVLRGRLGEQPWEKSYDLSKSKQNAEFIPRLWAKRHIDELLKSGVEFKDEIVALSKQYYVVTPHTSLIVLENDEMYKQYKVERGRKDHWALYPAPKEIEVVKEPVDWSQWSWWGGAWEGDDAKVKAKTKPKSVQEIVESVQFRINAPFYYWRPQRFGQGRYALYQLLDNDADPTRLLTYVFALASGKPLPTTSQEAGVKTDDPSAPSGQSATSTPMSVAGVIPPMELAQSLRSELFLPMGVLGPVVDSKKKLAASAFVKSPASYGRLGSSNFFDVDPVNQSMMTMSGGFYYTPAVRYRGGRTRFARGLAVSGKMPQITTALPILNQLQAGANRSDKRLAAASTLADGLSAVSGYEVLGAGHRPTLDARLSKALSQRWARIDRDVRNFNRQYGYWGDEWGSNWNSLDLTRSANARWYGGLEGLLGGDDEADVGESLLSAFIDVDKEEDSALSALVMDNTERISLSMMFTQREADRPMPPMMQMAAYGRAMKTLPGACAILAADYIVPRRAVLRGEGEEKQRELQITEFALAGAEAAAARLEDSGAFWSYQGWNYRPQPWTFQPPTIQAYPNYNWSFDLTRYADGLYSTQFDVLNEVVEQFGLAEGRGEISDEARGRIDKARAAIRPVRMSAGEAGPEILAASGDRFAVRRRTEMYLHERMVCDGQNVLHEYAELGLVARRKAAPLRLAALRQLAPQFVQPADAMARRFDVLLDHTDGEGFGLRLTPVGQPDKDKDQYSVLVRISNDGLIRDKALMVNDQLQLKLVYQYEDEKITVRWFDKNKEELAEHVVAAKPLDLATITKEKTFEVDVADRVVIDMPLRRPSYYTEQLGELAEDDVEGQVRIKRHFALASIQQLQWRRWGQANPQVQKSLTEAIDLLNKAGRKATLGDVTLLGSAGNYQIHELLAGKTNLPKSNPVYRYFQMRRSGSGDVPKLRDESPDSLVGHLSAYYAATQHRQSIEPFETFLKKYADSPLVIAAAWFRGNWGGNPEPWLRLFEEPRWRGMAVLMAAGRVNKPEHRAKLAEAFKKWHDEIIEAGYDVAIPQQLVNQLKQHDDGKLWREIVTAKWQRTKEQKDIAPVLVFAENAMAWGESKLAEEALQVVGERLEGRDTLLVRLAKAQAHWAGGRTKDALKLYDEILGMLHQKEIQPSPALLAATARLAQQAGDAGRAIELEEQALAAEHPYLPEMINLQSFRQRYYWLWQQYQAKIQSAVSEKDEKAVASWLARATETWQRWFEVDHENPAMIQQMATMLATAGRDDDAWLYLSTLIDQKPKDATSYYHVGSWYLGRNNPDVAQQYYATAYTWDTANPRWLVERAKVLDNMKRGDEARKLYRQVIDGKWAPGLQGYVNQAKQALK